MRKVIAYLISIYQSKISPFKGFSCAHKGLHKGDSCSEYTKQKILEKGFFSSLNNIRNRFSECREAAETIQRSSLRHQRGDCDLGIGGCASCDLDIGSCGGNKSILPLDCMSSCDLFGSDRKNRKRDYWILAIFILSLLIAAYYFIGRQVESVDIRLKEGVEETIDRALSKILKTQLPDYKIIFVVKNGRKTTNTLKNTSAKHWVSLEPRRSIYPTDIQEMTIVDKNITKDVMLESFTLPQKSGKGEKFEYKIKKRWDFF